MLSNQPAFKFVLLAGDILSLTAAALFALNVAAPGQFSELFSKPLIALAVIFGITFSLLVYLFMYFVNNLYKRQTFRSRYRHMTVILKSILVSSALLLPIIVIFAWTFFSVHGRDVLIYFIAAAFIGNSVLRLLLVRYFVTPMGRTSRTRRLLLVGSDDAAKTVINEITVDPRSTFEIVGIVDDYKEKGEEVVDDWSTLGRLDDLNQILTSLSPDEILIAIDNAPYSRLVNVVESCLATGCVVRIFSNRLKVLASRLGAEQYAEGIPVIMLSQIQPSSLSLSVRKFVDIAVSLVALVLLSPILICVVIGIKMSSRGPIIFRQTRIGYGGRPFDFYKFRSMHLGNSTGDHKVFVEKFIKGESEDSGQGQALNVFKIKDDPRIFAFGRFIRRTSLDEFPQLINVLKGDMGLVGPRPCLPYEWDAYDDWHKERLKVLPGCTGLWQVLGRSTVTFEDMVIMDLYYISNYSLLQDARIIYKTIPAIFFARGGF